MSQDIDVAIIGAGPYGLSLAAHLRKKNVAFRIFGRSMETWRTQMPAGMDLKSDGFACSLFHPEGLFTLEDFCAEKGIPYAKVGLPVALQTFAAYGVAFQQRFVPDLEETLVTSVTREASRFRVQLENGASVRAAAVVVAVGVTHYDHLPAPLSALSSEFLSHSSRYHSWDHFAGRDVIVVGAGASAIDVAASLSDAGAHPQLVTRRAVVPFHKKAPNKRSVLARLRAPWSGLGPGWRSRLACDLPTVFHRMPSDFRLNVVKKHLGPAPGWSTQKKIVGRVPVHLNVSIVRAEVHDGKVHLHLDRKGEEPLELIADHVIAGTGYRVDVTRLRFLDAGLRQAIAVVEGNPVLSRNFQSSVRGLYFIGPSAASSFGPMLRFAFGAGFTSRHLSRHLAATRVKSLA